MIVALGYILSRFLFYACGIHWDSTFLSWGWQALDPQWMKEDLAESIWFLHSQPPLFNLGIGLMLKISPESYDLWLQTFFRIMGLGMFLSMTYVLKQMNVRPWLLLMLVFLFMLSPSAVVYENWLFYTYPTACLLAFSLAALVRFLQTRKTGWSLAFFSLLVAVVLTRSLFQWFWLVFIFAMLYFLLKEHRKALLRGGTIPVLFLVLFLLKNALLFGFWGTSSWSGMNLGRIAFLNISQDMKDRLVREGQIPRVCNDFTFQPLSSYAGEYETVNPYPGVRALSDTSAHGTVNFNHWDYIEISKQYGKGAKKMIRLAPVNYVKNIGVAVSYYFQPPTAYNFVQDKAHVINGYNKIYNYAVMGTFKNPEDLKTGGSEHWNQKKSVTLLVGLVYGLVFLLALRAAWIHRKSFRKLSPLAVGVMSFTFVTIAYIFLLSSLTEVGENMRFRFLTLPIGWVLIGAIADQWLKRWKSRKGSAGSEETR